MPYDGLHVGGRAAARDQRRTAVDHPVEDGACLVVPRFARTREGAGEAVDACACAEDLVHAGQALPTATQRQDDNGGYPGPSSYPLVTGSTRLDLPRNGGPFGKGGAGGWISSCRRRRPAPAHRSAVVPEQAALRRTGRLHPAPVPRAR